MISNYYYKVKELAALLKVHRKTIDKWRKEGLLEYRWLGRIILIPKDQEFLKNKLKENESPK